MAHAFVKDGVTVVACTPHILPGIYPNTGTQIRAAVDQLQNVLDDEGIPLKLISGADNHVVPSFVQDLHSGHLLSLGSSRYVLVEPPHHVVVPMLDELFFGILVAGYVPILTHPERLSWISGNYDLIVQLAEAGVWMQITAGSLDGSFGKTPKYWSERMVDEGLVHILATDAHDPHRRPPNLSVGRDIAARLVGDDEATRLVLTRPRAILDNLPPDRVPAVPYFSRQDQKNAKNLRQPLDDSRQNQSGGTRGQRGIFDGLRRLLG